jgi:hypothetical protein
MNGECIIKVFKDTGDVLLSKSGVIKKKDFNKNWKISKKNNKFAIKKN